MNSFEQRLVEVMKRNGIANAPQLAKRLAYSGSERVRLVLAGKSKPSYGMLVDLASKLAGVDLHWLITGESRIGSKAAPSSSNENHEFVTRQELEDVVAAALRKAQEQRQHTSATIVAGTGANSTGKVAKES